MLGNIAVVPVSARKRTGLDVLLHAVVHHYEEEVPENIMVYSDEIEKIIEVMEEKLRESYPDMKNYRWHALKLMERDEAVSERCV